MELPSHSGNIDYGHASAALNLNPKAAGWASAVWHIANLNNALSDKSHDAVRRQRESVFNLYCGLACGGDPVENLHPTANEIMDHSEWIRTFRMIGPFRITTRHAGLEQDYFSSLGSWDSTQTLFRAASADRAEGLSWTPSLSYALFIRGQHRERGIASELWVGRVPEPFFIWDDEGNPNEPEVVGIPTGVRNWAQWEIQKRAGGKQCLTR